MHSARRFRVRAGPRAACGCQTHDPSQGHSDADRQRTFCRRKVSFSGKFSGRVQGRGATGGLGVHVLLFKPLGPIVRFSAGSKMFMIQVLSKTREHVRVGCCGKLDINLPRRAFSLKRPTHAETVRIHSVCCVYPAGGRLCPADDPHQHGTLRDSATAHAHPFPEVRSSLSSKWCGGDGIDFFQPLPARG